MSELILFATKTESIQSHSFRASSTIPFKSIVFAARNEPSDVITSLQLLSLIHAAKAVDEKPANTTECMAPIRAHAKTETASSGIMGR